MEAFLSAVVSLPTMWLLVAAFAGVSWGILGGALPGISPSIAMALLLPFTVGMVPATAIVLLASVYVGAEYGGSIPAILIRTPGTNSASATVLDGYEMARQGKAGEALGISLMSGLIGGLFGLLVLVLATESLARVALAFTPAAYFSLGILGLSVIAGLSGGSLLRGVIAACIGLMLAFIGSDPVSGVPRFTFGSADLLGGIKPILVMVGLFAVTEMLVQIGEPAWAKAIKSQARLKLPNLAMSRRLFKPQAIGAVIGTVEGVTPGAGGTIAAFMAYSEAKRWSKHPEEFGKGSPEGIAAPESANNVVTATALVPLLSLGIPGSNSAAILLGGFMIHGLQPGPMLFQKAPEVVWSLYGGLFFANIAMLLIGLVILAPCIWLVNRPKPYLMAFILALVMSGVYAMHQSLFELGLVLGIGVLGYGMRLLRLPVLPLVLGLVLGYLVESNYRRSLLISGGEHSIFVTDPVSLALLMLALALTLYTGWKEFATSKKVSA
ncbi:tripartite tricarboxylate transporter permease [Polaromonas sp.]|jgi:putative tricarboxylic transport membrane protein|uniref:tripartite tricarboxylate transporter permease n=1 Tax=Polaromonas sp. TaxID=1869339 RepID=UPI001D3DF6FF|nr:tripartite tricarboxylate transporter permease [Polaromonas sp.]MBT9476133.1 tripartite tricarboxylate transporter permease [Polaromonas sp.]